MQNLGKHKFTFEAPETLHMWTGNLNKIPQGEEVYEFEVILDGVTEDEMYDEKIAAWLQKEDPNIFTVVKVESIDNLDYEEVGHPGSPPIRHN